MLLFPILFPMLLPILLRVECVVAARAHAKISSLGCIVAVRIPISLLCTAITVLIVSDLSIGKQKTSGEQHVAH